MKLGELDQVWEKRIDARDTVVAIACVWRQEGTLYMADRLRDAVDAFEATNRAWDAAYFATTTEGRAEQLAIAAMVAEGAPECAGRAA